MDNLRQVGRDDTVRAVVGQPAGIGPGSGMAFSRRPRRARPAGRDGATEQGPPLMRSTPHPCTYLGSRGATGSRAKMARVRVRMTSLALVAVLALGAAPPNPTPPVARWGLHRAAGLGRHRQLAGASASPTPILARRPVGVYLTKIASGRARAVRPDRLPDRRRRQEGVERRRTREPARTARPTTTSS